MAHDLDAFVEPIDIRQFEDLFEPSKASFAILDQTTPGKRHIDAKHIDEHKFYASQLLEDYGRGFTQTITDKNLDVYTEKFIIRALNTVLAKHCRAYLVVPDYSPKDGRLHFHGIINFSHVKNMRKLRKDLKFFGWTNIDLEPKAGLPEYIFKIYEENKYTPKNFKVEKLKTEYLLKK